MSAPRIIVVTDKYETTVIDASHLDAALLHLFGLFDGNEYYMGTWTNPNRGTWTSQIE
jgi:hypothetical protein